MARTTEQAVNYSEALLERVFSGSFSPGSKLVEQNLADDLGVSRSPIRQSLTQLVAQGVLVGGRNRQGTWLREYSIDETRELYHLREWLEAGAAHYAATAANETDLERLDYLCQQMQACLDEPERNRFPDFDRRFHLALVEASHNERFICLFRTLLMECHYVFYGSLTAHRSNAKRAPAATDEQVLAHRRTNWRDSLEHHLEIVQLLKARDASGVERSVRQHVQAAVRAAIRIRIAREGGEGPPSTAHTR